MGLFKKIFKNDILFSEKGKNKFKLILNLESSKSDNSIILSYLDGQIKDKIKINEKKINDYNFIMKTDKLFYEKYKKVTPDFLINEMDTAGVGVGGTADSQFSSDFYAPDDARNIFGGKNKKQPIVRRPKITDTITKTKKKKKRKNAKGKKTKTKS